MSFARDVRFIVLVTAGFMGVAIGTCAQTCTLPSGFVAPVEQLVAHIEEVAVDRPLAVVLSAGSKASLTDAIHKSNSLPGVAGDYPLNNIRFGTPGAGRLVCLSDGSTLEEQVLEREDSKSFYRFRYIVWTYSFKLKDHEFPGYLGALAATSFASAFSTGNMRP
jgi:hypothetical protein